MRYRLIRYYPQKVEIDVSTSQILSMFPIELQHHPFFGTLKRVWKTQEAEYSVESFNDDEIQIITPDKYVKIKDEVMLEILHNIERFQIVLYYSDKQDVYDVVKV